MSPPRKKSVLDSFVVGCWSMLGHAIPVLGVGIGAFIGIIFYCTGRYRRRIARQNIKDCLENKNTIACEIAVITCFINLGIAIYEISLSWSVDPDKFSKNVEIHGRQILDEAVASGKGVLLIGGHYTTMELIAPALYSLIGNFAITFRKQNRQAISDYIDIRRSRLADLISVRDPRQILRYLRTGGVLWFAFDQDLGIRRSVFATFFGKRAATVTTPSRLIRASESIPVFVSFHRIKRNKYRMEFQKFPQWYPDAKNEVLNAQVLNTTLENAVHFRPYQYYWVHRRFKTQPTST